MNKNKNLCLIAIIESKVAPTESQANKIQKFLENKYHEEIELHWHEDENINGFVLTVADDIYDWTVEGKLNQLKEYIISLDKEQKDVIPLITENIKNWAPEAEAQEAGVVERVGDGIAVVSGLSKVYYGEILIFSEGIRGMILDIQKEEIGCVLFGDDEPITAGSFVYRTKKTAGIGVGKNVLGRVVNALGVPIDGKGDVVTEDYYPVEREAPGILARQPVYKPMETGLLAIDSMFPIGRGQRELIIGDRQTGKTAIALDTIVNQKGKNVVCIYVAIGQKASSVAQLVENLQQKGAMDYTTVVCATASDSAAMQYIAPYAGTAIAEYFMHRGEDALIIYDDLSKHAIAYRSISLLLERSPGREAYPGDVFYLHSRLLERSAQLDDSHGGGSITALPIVETQSGDVSAYIPTNIISITDGQIFLESELFFAGQRPAVNVGLSVSRVGGDAQTQAVKKASGTLRIDLAQYREMEVFTQFASDLDEATKRQLRYGQGLMELLKQPQYEPYKQHEQVVILVVSLSGLLTDIPRSRIQEVMHDLMDYIKHHAESLMKHIDETGEWSSDVKDEILSLAKQRLKERNEVH